jgi:hypothetical protein
MVLWRVDDADVRGPQPAGAIVALTTLLFVISQLIKTPARWPHSRLAKVRRALIVAVTHAAADVDHGLPIS